MLSSYKRVFVLHSNTGVTAPVFTEETLATQGGRMDVVARAYISALWDMTPPRSDTLFVAVLHGPPNPPAALYIGSSCGFTRRPGEKDVAAIILRALRGEEGCAALRRQGTLEVVQALRSKDFRVYLLSEDGENLENLRLSSLRLAFVLGDHIGFPRKLLARLRSECDSTLSLGRRPYLASHCIAYVHEVLDRASGALS
jgi:tRNA (pseudouridine54-N1)-methyltransferase